eukprot:2611292-Rhodomonas_salina.2
MPELLVADACDEQAADPAMRNGPRDAATLSGDCLSHTLHTPDASHSTCGAREPPRRCQSRTRNAEVPTREHVGGVASPGHEFRVSLEFRVSGRARVQGFKSGSRSGVQVRLEVRGCSLRSWSGFQKGFDSSPGVGVESRGCRVGSRVGAGAWFRGQGSGSREWGQHLDKELQELAVGLKACLDGPEQCFSALFHRRRSLEPPDELLHDLRRYQRPRQRLVASYARSVPGVA